MLQKHLITTGILDSSRRSHYSKSVSKRRQKDFERQLIKGKGKGKGRGRGKNSKRSSNGKAKISRHRTGGGGGVEEFRNRNKNWPIQSEPTFFFLRFVSSRKKVGF